MFFTAWFNLIIQREFCTRGSWIMWAVNLAPHTETSLINTASVIVKCSVVVHSNQTELVIHPHIHSAPWLLSTLKCTDLTFHYVSVCLFQSLNYYTVFYILVCHIKYCMIQCNVSVRVRLPINKKAYNVKCTETRLLCYKHKHRSLHILWDPLAINHT